MPPKPPHQNHGGTEPKKKKPFYEDLQDGKYIADGIIDVVCKATSLCFDRGTSIPVLTTDYVRHLVKHFPTRFTSKSETNRKKHGNVQETRWEVTSVHTPKRSCFGQVRAKKA